MAAVTTEQDFFAAEIAAWKLSPERKWQVDGERYYHYDHDILKRERTVIGKTGGLEVVHNLPNNRLIDNQYAKMVDQKTNYLLGKPFKFSTDNEQYTPHLESIFDKDFSRLLQNLGEDSLNCAIAWLFITYDEDGKLTFKRFPPHEVLPYWKDSEHTRLDVLVRVYTLEQYGENGELELVEMVEVYKPEGVERYTLVENVLIPDGNGLTPYITVGGAAFNWGRIPVVAFKYNDDEIPLIKKVKSLQDALNECISDFQNNMQEDNRNTILVINNHDGEDLGDFRHNLAAYGAIKTQTVDGVSGGVSALRIEVNHENYKAVTESLKQAIIDNAMGFDAKVLKSGSPNQMNILSIFADIDLDADGMETEWQYSLEQLLQFVDIHLVSTGKGDYTKDKVNFTFNRNMMLDAGAKIQSIQSSVGLVSQETLLENHPFVTDAAQELERMKADRQPPPDEYDQTPNQKESNENE